METVISRARQWAVADSRPQVRSQTNLDGHLVLPRLTCVPVGKFPTLSELQSLYLNNGLCCGCCSFVQSCSTLCNPMDFSTPGFPVLYHFMEFAQTHIHPTISSSVVPFPSLQSFPASLSFLVSRFFASDDKILEL